MNGTSARLVIVGSREFAWPGAEARARWMIATCIDWLQPGHIASGGAAGVDTWAEEAAIERGMTEANGRLVVMRPTRRRWPGPGGFQDRNDRLAAWCTHLLCIRCPRSTTYGSGYTADRAEDLGVEVWRRLLPA